MTTESDRCRNARASTSPRRKDLDDLLLRLGEARHVVAELTSSVVSGVRSDAPACSRSKSIRMPSSAATLFATCSFGDRDYVVVT